MCYLCRFVTNRVFSPSYWKYLTNKFYTYLSIVPPIVSIIPSKHLVMIEGEDLSLFCNYSSNHIIERLDWKKVISRNNLQSLNESSQYFHINAINRRHAGQYKCTVKNMAGIDSDSVTIEVYCKCYFFKLWTYFNLRIRIL